MALPTESDPAFPTASPSHQKACTNLLSSSIRRQTERKPQSQKTNQNEHMDHSLYEPCHVGPPNTDESQWRVLMKCGPLEKGMANHINILALRTSWTVWKDKKDLILKDEPSGSVGVQYATGEEWRNSSRKNEEAEPKQKWCPAVDVSGGESKVWCCKILSIALKSQ